MINKFYRGGGGGGGGGRGGGTPYPKMLDSAVKKGQVMNPFQTDGIFHKAKYYKSRMIHFVYRGVTGYNFHRKCCIS